ncbi:MAG: FxLYD domain-containing protein [Anaerolineae bacterium]
MRHILAVLTLFILAGCGGGAVVFAPPPPPPDTSPLVYTHPGGVFSLAVPRDWSAYEQNTTILASTAFSPPDSDEPALQVAVMNIGEAATSASLADIIDQYQQLIRPDVTAYTEVNRQAMGDGSWRLDGLLRTAGGMTRQLNTFIQQSGNFLTVIEVQVVPDPARMSELQQSINTFTINPNANLEAAKPTVLGFSATSDLEFLHVTAWTTPRGVFFITGEVANHGPASLANVPVRAVLRTPDGVPVAEAVDTLMGYNLPPGGFAPFSLRFGQGQPALTNNYDLSLGGVDWQPETNQNVHSTNELSWSDNSSFEADGSMVISGSVTNTSTGPLLPPRIVVTVFDAAGNVIAAAYTDVAVALNPSDATDYRVVIPEMGGQPANYLVTAQSLS